MFIQTEILANPDEMKYYPGEPVLPSGQAEFPDAESAVRSPLAQRIFMVEGVEALLFGPDFITVTRDEDYDWQILKPLILGAIMEHYTSGSPVILGLEEERPASADADVEVDEAILEKIKDIIDTRIRPAAQQAQGDVIYQDFKDGYVLVEFVGGAISLLAGINNVLQHYVPEVKGVKDFRDAAPKPGMDTPEAREIMRVLDERINPAVAGHGGHIALIDVQEDTVYIRLEGGCQGCGMADVTLKQGVEVEIKSAVPSIAAVLDVTDHAGGTNPYYTPGKSGMEAY